MQRRRTFRWWSLSLPLQFNDAVVMMGLGEKVTAGGRIDGEEVHIHDGYVGLEGGETVVFGLLDYNFGVDREEAMAKWVVVCGWK
ncbi:hypothetical protein SESBI_19527 [Sesbania bispinosa]|nr:hypothetical protein SESBI_19527 [Sesbania bispinosa]